MAFRTRAELEAGLEDVRQSPQSEGRLAVIVRRPAVGARETPDEGMLDLAAGLVGDNWSTRGGRSHTADVRRQLTLMNVRAVALVAGDRTRWPLAGDQLLVDFDLSAAHVPPGTRLHIGDAVVEITEPPHRGCHKFTARFGAEATAFVNSPAGIRLNLRGVNARVVVGGGLRVGDPVTRV
jgi:MOSC domain-containing protein YiiM